MALAILGPLLLPGAVLTLDMRLGPNSSLTTQFYGLNTSVQGVMRVPIYSLLWLMNLVMPFWLWQKLLFILIFFFAGVSAHRLSPFKGASAYFCGLLYMINPFTYVRFLAGQWSLLTAYALAPFAIKAFLELIEERSFKNTVRVVLLTTLVGGIYDQGFFLLFFAYIIIWGARLLSLRQMRPSQDITKFIALAAIIFILLNSFWLLPLLTVKQTAVETIGQLDLLSFASRPTSNLGIMFDIASLYGFWRGGYTYTKDILPFWWLIFVFILFLVVYGALSFGKDKRLRWIVTTFSAIAVASFILAVGAGSSITKPLFEWLFWHIPFFNIFRDSQKFVALICLSYAFLGGLGVQSFQELLRQEKKRNLRLVLVAILALSLASPGVYSLTMFGFHGQLGVTDYPKGWHEVNEYLNKDKDDFNVLFLPWHEFMNFNWLPNKDKRLGNPARVFFDKPMIQGDNIEMPAIYTQSQNPISNYVDFLVDKLKDKKIANLGELLAPLNVKYVILVDEADFEKYEFIYKQGDLTVELTRPGITLLRNNHQTARVYAVNGTVYIKSLDEYLELSLTQDVMENLYILGTGNNINSAGMEALNFSQESPVKYKVSPPKLSYIIFTVPQQITTDYWEYNGEKPLKNLGFVPAFVSQVQDGEISYTRFSRVYVPGYAISFLTLTALLWFSARRHALKGKTLIAKLTWLCGRRQ